MIINSYNPIERGLPAIWLEEPIASPFQVTRLVRHLRDYPKADGPIDIVIAGGGGNCSLGLEMYTALRECRRQKRVTIFSAPSMSGVIAMAGDHIRIVEAGSIFLHHSGYAAEYLSNCGPARHIPAAAMRGLARGCDATDAVHVGIFARRTGLAPDVISSMRAAETTLDASEALRLGFVDEVIGRRA